MRGKGGECVCDPKVIIELEREGVTEWTKISDMIFENSVGGGKGDPVYSDLMTNKDYTF